MDTKNYGPDVLRGLIEEAPTTRELLQQALDALYDTREIDEPASGLMNRIRYHLEKPEPEPVAWMVLYEGKCMGFLPHKHDGSIPVIPVFTKEQL